MNIEINPKTLKIIKLAAAAAVFSLPVVASAQASGFQVPFVQGIGCDVVNWMKGPLAMLVFVIVAVATFVIGLFAKMDWTKILTVIILFGVLQATITILINYNQVSMPSCINP